MKGNIAILHYHLHPGGVTSIIKSQVKSLSNNGMFDIRVLSGDCQNHKFLFH
ncbi:MAG: hypothetical protein RQ761_13055 [Bacteroidales bacterium]|nr:hypothetical protein [Bacteroidales bacterium]